MEEIINFSSEIVEDSNQYLVSNSIMFKQDMLGSTYSYIPAPVSLKPSPFSKEVYERIRSYQNSVNLMVEKLMNNIDKIYEFLAPISESDEFIANLISIAKNVKRMPYEQIGYLGIMRTDYMITEENEPKLVELNTIASGLGAISDKMKGYYEYLIDKHYPSLSTKNLPSDSQNIESIVDSMKAASDLYSEHQPNLYSKQRVLAYIVDYSEANI